MVNVTGWENLSQGKIPQAAWNLYSEMFAVSPGGPSYFTIIMFLFGSYILYIRTRNLGIVISMQMLFLAVFFPYFGGLGITLAVVMIAIEFGLMMMGWWSSR